MAQNPIRYLLAPRVNRTLGESLVEILASLEPGHPAPQETESVAEADLVIATDWEETLSAATRARAGQVVFYFNTGDVGLPGPLPTNVVYVDADARFGVVSEKLQAALRCIGRAGK